MKLRSLFPAAVLTLAATSALAQPMPGQRIPSTDPNGTYCREYQQTVTVGGRLQDSYGTACQQPDGSWKILPSDLQSSMTPDEPPVEYISAPQYISPPVYTVPPPAYYQPQPYYGPYAYPYSRPYYGSSISFSFGSGGYRHGGHHGSHHGHHHGHH